MIDPEVLRPLRDAAEDYQETENLKHRLRNLKHQRPDFYLTSDELDCIFRWKLRGQYRRIDFSENTDSGYRAITRAAFSIKEANAAYEATLRLKVLMSLPGVGIGVASAILALCDPDNYCVIDYRGWHAAFGEIRHEFEPSHYLRYLRKVKCLANALNWTPQGKVPDWSPQEVDLALWVFDQLPQ
jgi:hypothetical protein